MEWKLFKNEKPPIRDCDKNSSDGWSLPLIVYNGTDVIDDCRMYFKNPNVDYAEAEAKYIFYVHAFGYDNDLYKVENVTHWMTLPEPPSM